MMEVWLQITCNGCGETDNSEMPNMTKTEYRAYMREKFGWRRTTDDLDYCRTCVAKGALEKRPDTFGAD